LKKNHSIAKFLFFSKSQILLKIKKINCFAFPKKVIFRLDSVFA